MQRVKQIDWRLLATRPELSLLRCASDTAYTCGHFAKITGLDWQGSAVLFVDQRILFVSSEMDAMREKIKAAYAADSGFFTKFAENCYSHCEKFKTLVTATQKTGSTFSALLASFNSYFDAHIEACCFLLPLPPTDSILTEEIKLELSKRGVKGEEVEGYLAALTYPEKENNHVAEMTSFYKLCKIEQQGNAEKLQRAITRHLKQFAWIGSRQMWDTAWTQKDILQRIAELKKQGKDTSDELKKFKQSRRQAAKELKKAIRKLKLQPEERLSKLAEIAREYAYLRTYRTDSIHYSNYQAGKMLRKIAKKLGITYTDVTLMSANEVRRSLEEKKLTVSREVLAERNKDYATLSLGCNFEVLSGADLQQLKKELRDLLAVQQATELKGNVAFAGKVTGRAKIVMTQFDLDKVQQGDVLVTVMTFPNYVSAMQRASAFVTDEGGILCHAAIVARELAKPCVIGTKTATKVFRDGDTIEVDAEKGIVRKVG